MICFEVKEAALPPPSVDNPSWTSWDNKARKSGFANKCICLVVAHRMDYKGLFTAGLEKEVSNKHRGLEQGEKLFHRNFHREGGNHSTGGVMLFL